MSLKGYQWFNDKQEVVMSFTFKDRTIDIWRETTEEEINKFVEFLRANSFKDEKFEIINHCKGE